MSASEGQFRKKQGVSGESSHHAASKVLLDHFDKDGRSVTC